VTRAISLKTGPVAYEFFAVFLIYGEQSLLKYRRFSSAGTTGSMGGESFRVDPDQSRSIGTYPKY